MIVRPRGVSASVFALSLLAAVSMTPTVDASIIAQWHMDEGTGDVIHDSSGNTHDGAITGAAWTDGVSGKALKFDGVADHVAVQNVPTSEFTLEAWVYLQRAPSTDLPPEEFVILEKWFRGGAWVLSIISGLLPSLDWGVSGSGIRTVSSSPIELNRWHCLTASVAYDVATNRSSAKIYIDGEVTGSLLDNPDPGPPTAHDTGVSIGAANFGDTDLKQFFPGIIDEVTIYDVALSDDEVSRNCLSTITVAIDIKPRNPRNRINPKSKGKIPVAILSEPDFDAPSRVDTASLTFGRTGNEQSLAFCQKRPQDVNRDGLLDLVCHFKTQATGFQTGDTVGVLKGKRLPDIPLQGTDSVKIVP